jgi:AP-2 complex subunit alpha
LLRLYRKFPDIIPVRDWAKDIVNVMDDKNLGVAHAATCLVLALSQQDPDAYAQCVTKAIMKLTSIVVGGEFDPVYLYYKIPAPWLQVKLLRLLQYYPSPQSPELIPILERLMRKLLEYASTHPKNYNQANTVYSVVVEAMNYLIHLDPYSELIQESGKILGQFLESKDTNMRYLALETMAHIASTGDPLQTLARYQLTVLRSLSDKDISIRRRALDVLYSTCTPENCREIVQELLNYLAEADYEFQEELVLKIAILSEKFVSEYTWYVDVILKLITTAGDAASDSLWHRVVQIVTNHPDLREYAAYTILQAAKEPNCHEVTIRIAGHILGEFGHVIVESPGCSPLEQYMALHSKFGMFSNTTRAILLNTYVKFCNLFPEIKHEIVKLFENYTYALDPELQQRACEYLAIIKDETMLAAVCEEMPAFPERESSLLSQLTKKVNDTEDGRTWMIGGVDAQEELSKKRELAGTPKSPGLPSTLTSTTSSSPAPVASPVMKNAVPSAKEIDNWFQKLLTSKNGILYEDSILQIGVKAEYQSQLGRVALFFGNKTTQGIQQFQLRIEGAEGVNVTPVDKIHTVIPPGTQLHQLYNVELEKLPMYSPYVHVSFLLNQQNNLKLKLPIVLSKFMMGVSMESSDFMSRWKVLTCQVQETLHLNAIPSFDSLAELGLSKIENVDPNPMNGTYGGILSCSELGKIGILVRIEKNVEHKMVRITLKSTNELAAKLMLEMICSNS